jgi:hypothetical protein
MANAEPDVLAYMTFPLQHRAKLHSTNPLERLNGEIKRRTELVGVRAFLRTGGGHALTPQRGRHHAVGRSDPARAERRVGRPALPLHDP